MKRKGRSAASDRRPSAASSGGPTEKGWRALLERLFGLRARNATVAGELVGGVTTYMTMAYIIFVNAAILSACGMPRSAVMVATCLAAALSSILMGVYANLPVALAPGMGMNALVAYTLCRQPGGFAWQEALGLVFWSGLVFLALSLVKFRETVIGAIPRGVKYGAAAGIGLFIAFIGLQHAGLVQYQSETLVELGPLTARHTLVAVLGLAVTIALIALKVKGAVLIGIAATGLAALVAGLVKWETGHSLSLSETFLKLQPVAPFRRSIVAAVPAVLTLLFFDLFDTVGTLMGVAEEAKLVDGEGRIPNAGRALAVDATATVAGSLLGTTTVTSYIESAAGVAAGARTGLASVFTGALFLLSLAALPFVGVFGQGVRMDTARLVGGEVVSHSVTCYPITAPALVIVGFLMMGPLRKIDWDDVTEAFPAFLAVVLMPLTFSISTGLAAAFVSYAVLKLVTGRGRDVHPLVYAVSGAIVLGYAGTRLVESLGPRV
jgi:AGZA family xanthine/uracil permease-like MFS transporter